MTICKYSTRLTNHLPFPIKPDINIAIKFDVDNECLSIVCVTVNKINSKPKELADFGFGFSTCYFRSS